MLRAALEHSARAWWVLAGEGADERAARAWLARWVAAREEVKIATRDGGRSGAMRAAPERLADVEQRIVEVFDEAPQVGDRPWEHSLCGETIGSTSGIAERAARATLGDDAPVGEVYSTLSHLLHPSTTAVTAFAESDGKMLKIPRGEPQFLGGTTLTVLAIWRGTLQRVLDYHGWHHPQLPEWSDALDATAEAHNRVYSLSDRRSDRA